MKATRGETVLGEYSYDGQGRRVKKVASGVTVLYHYDHAGNLIAETDGGGNLLRAHIYLNGERVAMRIYGDKAGMYYFLNDHLGTPQKVVNSSRNVVWEAAYLPFGEAQIITETVTNNFRFPGQYFDAETGLHYNWHRYYDPKTGRYLTPDPIGLEGGVNLYGYCLNDPVNLTDPLGLWDLIISYRAFHDGAEPIIDMHYNRNEFNKDVTYEEAEDKWVKMTPLETTYHRMGPGNEDNVKFIVPDEYGLGSSEAVFHRDGRKVTDPANMATYNYFSPTSVLGKIGHVLFDVLPYWPLGNSPDDPSRWWERIFGTYEGDSACPK